MAFYNVLVLWQVALAVGDTETMKRFASIKRLAMQIESNIQIDEACPAFIARAIYKKVWVEKPNRLSSFARYYYAKRLGCIVSR